MGLYQVAKAAWLYMRMNNKGVEGLPLKYVIIILVAALVIAIAVTMTNTLGGGVKTAAQILNNTTITKINESLNY
ncbi:hypothetical protein HYS54_02805 [Candidatus Micrarchaeota archaeon]|nr:hypothetical protein [Candidatus Micrarchaeota archaeon]